MQYLQTALNVFLGNTEFDFESSAMSKMPSSLADHQGHSQQTNQGNLREGNQRQRLRRDHGRRQGQRMGETPRLSVLVISSQTVLSSLGISPLCFRSFAHRGTGDDSEQR
jgi:hypothetical protein